MADICYIVNQNGAMKADSPVGHRAARFCHYAARGGQIMLPLTLAQKIVHEWTGQRLNLVDDSQQIQVLHQRSSQVIPEESTSEPGMQRCYAMAECFACARFSLTQWQLPCIISCT